MKNTKLFIGLGGVSVVALTAVLCIGGVRGGFTAAKAEGDSYSMTRPLKAGYGWAESGFKDNVEETRCTFSWENGDDSKFTIQINDQYLSGTASGASLSLIQSPRYWYATKLNDKVVLTTEGTRWLSINPSWGIRYYNNTSNEVVCFWDSVDMQDWLWRGCEAQKGSFAKRCLQNLITPADPTPAQSSSEASSSAPASSETSSDISSVAPAVDQIAITPQSLMGYAGSNLSYRDGSAIIEGYPFEFKEIGCYGKGLQMRTKNGKSSAAYNTAAFAQPLKSIDIVMNESKYDNAGALKFSFGATAELGTDVLWDAVKGTLEYTIQVPEGMTYMQFQHNISYSLYIDSITLNF